MPLISCPACGRQISTAAEFCPQCGHPNRPGGDSSGDFSSDFLKSGEPHPAAAQPLTGPTCYACSLPATTRCQRCGALSCASHLQSIYAYHGQGGAYELRCQSCYSSAAAWRTFVWIMVGIGLVAVAIFFFGFWLPGWQDMNKKHEEFDRDFKKRQEEFDKKSFPGP
jgi:hypothetical protein